MKMELSLEHCFLVFHTLDICGKSQNGLKEAKLTPSSGHLQVLLYSALLSHLGDQSNSWGDFFNKDECQIILMRFHIQHLL